jgi:formate hydrogenlyase subunit 6/NADH:ubiquinone oxidoreductase subunit I
MTVLMKDNPNHTTQGGNSSRRKIIDKFWIDYARCMRCNICVEVCNFDAIAMNNTWQGHELSVHDRGDLVMDLQQLLAQHRQGAIKEWVAE